MSSVRAKFTVTEKTTIKHSPTSEATSNIVLRPVTGGSPENDSFYKWTPGGEIILATVNEAASDALVLGESYYVDFTRAEVA